MQGTVWKTGEAEDTSTGLINKIINSSGYTNS